MQRRKNDGKNMEYIVISRRKKQEQESPPNGGYHLSADAVNFCETEMLF